MLGQLQFGRSVTPAGQGGANSIDHFEQGQRQGQKYREQQAAEIYQNALAGIPQKQSLMSRFLNGRQENQMPNQMAFNAPNPGKAGPDNFEFDPTMFEKFQDKSNRTNLQNEMLSRVGNNPLYSKGIRSQLIGMMADKLPEDMQRQQRLDSFEMLENMSLDFQQKFEDTGDWEEQLSKHISNSPKAKQWYSNYIEPYNSEDENVPALVNKLKAKMKDLNPGATKEDMVKHSSKEGAKKYVRQLPGMLEGGKSETAMKELDTVIKDAEAKGYTFIKKGTDLILSKPGTIDLVLQYNPDTLSWYSDRWGSATLFDLFRKVGWG